MRSARSGICWGGAHDAHWGQGEAAVGNSSLRAGTAIATFEKDARGNDIQTISLMCPRITKGPTLKLVAMPFS
jgi:hypothetical protein